MKLKLTWVVVFALAGGLIAAGCGGDDNNDSSSTDNGATTAVEAITKSAFITEADQICKESNDQIDTEGRKLGNSPTKSELESFVSNTLVPGIQQQLDQIRALGAPAGDEDQVNALLDAAQADLDELEADPGLLSSNDEVFADANKLANDYGLKVCGSD